MNKTSTAVYMLIAVVIMLVVLFVSSPATFDKAGNKTGYLKLLNFKGKEK